MACSSSCPERWGRPPGTATRTQPENNTDHLDLIVAWHKKTIKSQVPLCFHGETLMKMWRCRAFLSKTKLKLSLFGGLKKYFGSISCPNNSPTDTNSIRLSISHCILCEKIILHLPPALPPITLSVQVCKSPKKHKNEADDYFHSAV